MEFAILLPIMMVLTFGIIDFGRMLNAEITLNEAAREGARAAAFNQNVSARVQAITGTPAPAPSASTVPCPSPVTPSSAATVTVTQNLTNLTILSLIGGSSTTKTLSATGVMPCVG